MSHASDQDCGPGNLSPLGERMRQLRESVIAEWESRVRAAVEGAGALVQPLLVNTFPVLYDNLTQAVSPDYPRTSAEVSTQTAALEHGGERARLTGYETKSVIAEYQILRLTIIDVLKQHNVPVSDDEMHIISSSIDAAIREAVTAYAFSQAALREQFIAALAHDLRNPLSIASTAAQLICRTEDPQAVQRYARKILENIGRVDRMIQQLLDTVIFEHGERLPLHPSNFDMFELVTQVCNQFASVHGPRFQAKGAPACGWWGRDLIQRALENLISNAMKYGKSDSVVRVTCDAELGRLQLSVHNEGDEIPPDQIEGIFQVFVRAKAAKNGDAEGWGIGLPFVRSVVESHGGSVDVDSSRERGTTFSMNIPVDSRPFQNAPTLETR
jgi:signal transduction histidine kinase